MQKVEMMKILVENDPENGTAWYLLGAEYAENGLLQEAMEAYSKAMKYADEALKSQILTSLTALGRFEDKIEEVEAVGEPESYDDDKVVSLKVISGRKSNDYIDTSEPEIDITFKDVGGLDKLKRTIEMKIIKPFLNQSLFDKFKKKTGGGILLYGPPGCGKTFIAKATSGECHARFQPVHITDILDPYQGVSAMNIKDIFATARAKKPCVLFFDEIDTIGFNRAKMSSEHMRPVVDQLLSEIEGIESSTDELLIIAATNTPWDVDPALKRPGRFDKLIFVGPPDEKAREAIFRLKVEGKPLEDKIDFSKLASKTPLYSGADIEHVIDQATENVLEEILDGGEERNITMDDLTIAIEDHKPTTVEWLNTIKNYVKYSNQSGLYDEVEKFLSSNKRYL